jgi:hypothetical protein
MVGEQYPTGPNICCRVCANFAGRPGARAMTARMACGWVNPLIKPTSNMRLIGVRARRKPKRNGESSRLDTPWHVW